jgi:hypothetical protein
MGGGGGGGAGMVRLLIGSVVSGTCTVEAKGANGGNGAALNSTVVYRDGNGGSGGLTCSWMRHDARRAS